MIPLELRLTNFLSYRDQAVVDLRAVHLACISGANGAGKSTLLDAMTWVLFGQSRVRSEDDVINTSASDGHGAEVELVFEMESVLYRVIRRRRLGKSTELEFQTAREGSDGLAWQVLTEARKGETQAAIESVLRMNYDVFVNASFFLQGKADEFTNRTAGKRKEILAEILGVTRWDAFAKRANAARKAAETDEVLAKRRLEEVSAELAEAEARQQRLAESLAREAAVQTRLSDREQSLQQARQLAALIEQQQRQADARAKELAEMQRELQRLTQRIDERRQEIARHEAIAAEASQIAADYAAWSAADAAFQEWQVLANQVHQLRAEQSPLEARIAGERSRLEQRQRDLEQRRGEADAGVAMQQTLQEARADNKARADDLVAQLEKLAEVEGQLRELELSAERLAAERRQQEQERQRLVAEKRRVDEARQEQSNVERVLRSSQERASSLSAELEQLAARAEQASAWTAERDQLLEHNGRLTDEAEREKARIADLADATGANCPLCGQPLTEAHRKAVVDQLQADLTVKRETWKKAQDRIKELQALLAEPTALSTRRQSLQRELETQQQRVAAGTSRLQVITELVTTWDQSGAEETLASLEHRLSEQPDSAAGESEIEALRQAVVTKKALEQDLSALQQEAARIESRLEQVERLAGEWRARGEPELATVMAALDAGTFALEERRQLDAIAERIGALQYDAAAHNSAREQREALVQAPERHQLLLQAQAALTPISEALEESVSQQSALQAKHEAVIAEHGEATAALATLRESAADTRALEQDVIRLREELSIASQEVGAAKQKVAVLEDRRRQDERVRQELRALEHRIQQLRQLEDACGRNGVQALLIEHALPEIQERANDLLDRLSGGSMRVRFETQRELKSRDALAETLEIHIADAAGTRPYENYSGGEQFRVNFAVRLALSQVLAHRAGAPLRTLVIDEGFGSQDPEGRQRLVEAVNLVQSDFACILVITHIDELRDAFPARIEVSKTGRGSAVQVIGGP